MKNIDRQYPGQFLYNLSKAHKYPNPMLVGGYTYSLAEFLSFPMWLSQWVHFKERTMMVLEGRYDEVRPVHFEGIFTLVCNMMCPHCTQRPARVTEETWKHSTQVSGNNTMSQKNIEYVLQELSNFKMDNYMGVVWGGGDPTSYPWVYSCMERSMKLGISSSFLTNGVMLDVNKIAGINPTLIRISLNCGNSKLYNDFHGCDKNIDSFGKVVSNIKLLSHNKKSSNNSFLLGISLIVDERNIDDLDATIDLVLSIQKQYPDSIDYILVRPVMQYSHFDKDYSIQDNDTKHKLLDVVREDSPLSVRCHKLNIPIVLVKDSFAAVPQKGEYAGLKCLSYGWFGQIKYNGDVQLCSDAYCNPEYKIGNILVDDLDTIWRSKKRIQLVNNVNKQECFSVKCPFNSRGHHLNRIFNQIEEFRAAGQMGKVVQWVNDLSEFTIPPAHSFFL